MRSVFVFFNQIDRDGVKECLDSLCTNYENREWVYFKQGDPVLYITFDQNNLINELRCEERQDTQEFLTLLEERRLNLVLIINISGRHPGNEEVLVLLQTIFKKHEGVALDDHTSHAWTLEEITNGYRYQNLTFFDYMKK